MPPTRIGSLPARVDVANDALGVARELRRGVDLRRIGDVDQVVRDAALLVSGHLVGADVEAAIDGGGVAVDDLAAVPLGQRRPSALFPDAVGPSTARTRGFELKARE